MVDDPMSSSGGFAPALEVADRLMRSWWTVVAGACLGLSGSLLALHYLPKTYEATTKILVAPPKLPQEFVKNTINDDTALRIAALREAVLSRPYMMKLIDESYGTNRSEAETQVLLQSIRGRVEVNVERFSREGTGLFAVKFRDSDPKRAAAFVNDLADLYIKENSKYRSGRAQETTTTLEQLARDVRKQLEAKEKVIADFRSQHLYELPERTDANLRLLESRQRDLDANIKSLQSAQEHLRLLEAQLQSSGASTPYPSASASPVDSYAARVAQLQRELAALKARYLDSHPEVRAKERELDDFVASAQTAPQRDAANKGDKPVVAKAPMSPLEREVRTQSADVAGLQQEQTRIRSDIALYSGRIERAPQVQQQLEERTKGYDALLQQYKQYESSVESAKGAQTIEEAQKGQQFEVIERAIPPAFPVQPIPAVIFALGLALGLFFVAGPIILLGFVRPTVQSEELLRSFVSVPILVSIPRIETAAVKRKAVVDRVRNIVLSTLSVAVLAIVVVAMYVR
jgi:polysaccharide chain length determinant protein (PEP-CTERM system associated)